MTPLPRLFILLVNWNGMADTLACLSSLRMDCYPAKHILVIDNGSTDDSVNTIRRCFPEVKVILTGHNLGFTGGNNIGIRAALDAGADYVLLLNNDTTVESDAIARLVAAAEMQASYGVFTPVVHYFDRPAEAWFAGSRINLRRGEAVHDNSSPAGPTEPVREIPWASGCAMMFRSRLLEQLGGFDDRFFLNWEDVDISLRARAAGTKIGLVTDARVYHKVGRSFAGTWGTGTYYYVRNQLLVLSLHGGRGRRAASFYVFGQHFRRAVRGIVHREPKCWRGMAVIIRAAVDHLVGRYGGARAPEPLSRNEWRPTA